MTNHSFSARNRRPRGGLGRLVAQVFRQDAQGLNQDFAIRHVKTIAVKIGKHPFVGIKTIAVSRLQPVVNPAIFRTQCRCAGHGTVHMQPEVMFTADSDFADLR